jgi:hypothetical protein
MAVYIYIGRSRRNAFFPGKKKYDNMDPMNISIIWRVHQIQIPTISSLGIRCDISIFPLSKSEINKIPTFFLGLFSTEQLF